MEKLPLRRELLHPVLVSNLIAIVGRPNVGKSALFNRIVGRRIAIVHDQPGVTRDRVSAEAEWEGHVLHARGHRRHRSGSAARKAGDVIIKAALEQVELAIEAATSSSWSSTCRKALCRSTAKFPNACAAAENPFWSPPTRWIPAARKRTPTNLPDWAFEKIFPVSAIHGEGINELMETAVALLAPGSPQLRSPQPTVELANRRWTVDSEPSLNLKIGHHRPAERRQILHYQRVDQSERVIVSPIPGTTRDAVDVPFEVETDGVRQRYILIDTAGMRKTRRVDNSIEFFSVQRAEESIARCDIAILVLDAEMGITEQDKKIADVIVENRKACIIVVNKWDLFEQNVRQAREEEITRRDKKERREGQAKEMSTLGEFGGWVQKKLFFPRLCAGDFHLGQIRLSPRTPARSHPLCRRAVAAENCRRPS
jgi:GTPase